MWSKSFLTRIVFIVIIIAAGGFLLFQSGTVAPESAARQDAVQMALAPGRQRAADSAGGEGTEMTTVYGAEVIPASVDISNIPSRAAEVDRLKEAYESGLIDLGINEGPVSDAVYQAMVNESLNQSADPSLQQYSAAESSQAALAISPGASFKSIEYSQSKQGVPPDPDITVGKDHIIAAVNTSFQIFDKTGSSLVGPMLFSDFWGNNCATGSSNVVMFDPFLDYDEKEGRYILGITAYDSAVNGGNNGYACIAVSQTDSANGSWWLYSFDGNPGSGADYFFDYPHLGVGQDALYLSANMFSAFFIRNHVFAYDKSAMYAGDPASFVKFDVGSSYFTIQPAKMHGYAAGGWPTDINEPHYFVDAQYGNNQNTLTVWQLSDPFGSASLTSAGTVTVQTYSIPVSQPQQGNPANLQGNDDRLLDVKYWGEKLYATQTIGCNPGGGTVNCIRWYIIDMSQGAASLVDQGTFVSEGVYRSFPAIAPNACGDLMVGYTMTNNNMYPSVYVAGRQADDPAGQLKDETLLKAGEAPYFAYDVPTYYSAYRWGDYTGMGIDPDGVTFWYVGEYSRNQANADWATWIGSYTFPGCSVGPTPTPTPQPTATNTPEPGASIHVSDLDASSTPVRNKWNAAVTITIIDASDNPVSNATVNGTWSNGASGSDSCGTDANGQCTITKTNLRSNISGVTFTVDSAAHAAYAYDSSANADADGDSDGTTINVYKDGAPTPTPAPSPTPTPGPPVVMHIGDLDGNSVSAPRNRWDAAVTIIVHDEAEGAVSGALVEGSWSDGAVGGGSCTTNSAGECTVTKTSIKSNSSSVTFTVSNVILNGSTYDNGANHDPDGDSNNGTEITILKP